MYKYEYIPVIIEFSGWGAFNGNVYSIDSYKEIINKKAKKGYRYVGFIPTKQRGTGHIEEIDLIFEKKEEQQTDL